MTMDFPVFLTPSAVKKIKTLQKEGAYLRLSLVPKGCSGFSYNMKYETQPFPEDIVIKQDDAILLIDAKAEFFLLGSTISYEISPFNEGFTFKNPNEESRCGCGESVYFKKKLSLPA